MKPNAAAVLARAIGVTASAIAQWVSAERPVPVKRCVLIERATRGKVTRQELRTDWREIWPELEALERAARTGRGRRLSLRRVAGYAMQPRRPNRQQKARMADLLGWSVAGARLPGHPRFKEIRL